MVQKGFATAIDETKKSPTQKCAKEYTSEQEIGLELAATHQNQVTQTVIFTTIARGKLTNDSTDDREPTRNPKS